MWADVIARSMRAAGARPGMKVHVAYGYGLFTGGLGAHYGAERLGCTVIPVSGGMTERQIQLMRDFEPDVIMVTPSYMLALLDEFRRIKVDARSCSLKVGMFGAEPWTNAMRHEIEQAFDMNAVDIYGLSEVIGPGVASECVETKDGPHIWEDHFYPEIIDPVTGRGAAGRRVRRAGVHLAHQGGDADHPLPHARPQPAAARHGARDAADGEGDGPLRRHDHPARRQRVPEPDRGADPEMLGAGAALRHRAGPRRPPRHHERAGRGPAGGHRCGRPRHPGQGAVAPRQGGGAACRSASMWSTPTRSSARSARPSACSTCGRGTRRARRRGRPGRGEISDGRHRCALQH